MIIFLIIWAILTTLSSLVLLSKLIKSGRHIRQLDKIVYEQRTRESSIYINQRQIVSECNKSLNELLKTAEGQKQAS